MPEGNETHRWSELHARMFGGKKVHVDSPQGRFLGAALVDGRTLTGVMAVGKHLGYDFGVAGRGKTKGERRIVHVHLGLYGDFVEGEMPMPEPRGALRMRIWDKTRWLELRGPTDCSVWNGEQWETLLQRLGPDPLNGDVPDRFVERVTKRKTPIGQLLMDQAVVSGLGNIFRAELLFRARVSPFRPGIEVSARELGRIWNDARKLMPQAMVDRRIVTTDVKDRPHRKGEALGEEAHYVYRRKGRPCFVCGTTVETKVMQGRNLFWCPGCQAV